MKLDHRLTLSFNVTLIFYLDLLSLGLQLRDVLRRIVTLLTQRRLRLGVVQVPRVLAAIDERLGLFSKLLHRVGHLGGRRKQQLDGRRFFGAESCLFGLHFCLELVARREKFRFLLVAIDAKGGQVLGVEAGSLEDVASRHLRFAQELLLRVDQGGQQALELIDDGRRFLEEKNGHYS